MIMKRRLIFVVFSYMLAQIEKLERNNGLNLLLDQYLGETVGCC